MALYKLIVLVLIIILLFFTCISSTNFIIVCVCVCLLLLSTRSIVPVDNTAATGGVAIAGSSGPVDNTAGQAVLCKPGSDETRTRKRKAISASSPCNNQLLKKLKMNATKKSDVQGKTSGKAKVNDKKKKLTCRVGKSSNRSKNCYRKPKPKPGGQDNDAVCLICKECFADSRDGEQWIQCQQCQEWCHEDCTDADSVSGYTCDFCR